MTEKIMTGKIRDAVNRDMLSREMQMALIVLVKRALKNGFKKKSYEADILNLYKEYRFENAGGVLNFV